VGYGTEKKRSESFGRVLGGGYITYRRDDADHVSI
jgi:hypothetical protein